MNSSWTRRQILKVATALPAVPLAGKSLAQSGASAGSLPGAGRATGNSANPASMRWSALAESAKYRKLDCHGHFPADPAAFLRVVDRLRIEVSVVAAPGGRTPEQFRAGNDRAIKLVRDDPKRFLAYCNINPRYREALDEVKRCLDAGMVGIGEIGSLKINDPVWFPIIELCAQYKAPMLIHTGADLGLTRNRNYRTIASAETPIAEDFIEVAKRYPEAVFIHGHIGGGDWEYTCKALRNSPNVYFDTCGSVADTDEGMVEFAIRYAGIERVIFGSDVNYEPHVGRILAATLTETQRRAIFWDNYAALLGKRGIHVA